ncbi:7943_t:CDS:1 [Scutellospora calospora]|uniref:7943_t:CDS:1 n=1 Tax=Scutellospora calospora TaxID=85575 RepID=A0ACA9M6I8_9GLOM|nr:7943_t:CDS:1 [Scutellospora calospora]
MSNFWDEIDVLNINEIYNPLQNFLDNWDIFTKNTNEALDNLGTNNENTSLSLQYETTQNEVPNKQQNLNMDENFENSSDESSFDENNEQSIIDKIKKDLQHEVDNNTEFTSPFEGYKDYKTFKNIVNKIEQLGNCKGVNKQRLEIAYYLGELRTKNQLNNKFI